MGKLKRGTATHCRFVLQRSSLCPIGSEEGELLSKLLTCIAINIPTPAQYAWYTNWGWDLWTIHERDSLSLSLSLFLFLSLSGTFCLSTSRYVAALLIRLAPPLLCLFRLSSPVCFLLLSLRERLSPATCLSSLFSPLPLSPPLSSPDPSLSPCLDLPVRVTCRHDVVPSRMLRYSGKTSERLRPSV